MDVPVKDTDPVLWIPSGRRLLSGLLGLNLVLLGTALLAGSVFNPVGIWNQGPVLFVVILMGLSLLWMLWYLMWARRQPGTPAHTDHHAGSTIVMGGFVMILCVFLMFLVNTTVVPVVLMVFAGLSLLLCVFRMGYYLLMKDCQILVQIILSFVQAPFFLLQTYFLWAHSKDCIHNHKALIRLGLILTVSVDILLWFSGVTDDSVHMKIELENQDKYNNTFNSLTETDLDNGTTCQCSSVARCLAFRKGYEILYPFNMEFCVLAGCMLFVMWKNVGRHVTTKRTNDAETSSPRFAWMGGVLFGFLLGVPVLVAGIIVFVLYHLWLDQEATRLTAFLLFYGFHLCLLPVMALCTLTATLLQAFPGRQNRNVKQKSLKLDPGLRLEGQENPTQRLDVALLIGTAVGQLSLSYLSFVAALALGSNDVVGNLDLSYSFFSLVELLLQNIFIIRGLYFHSYSKVNFPKQMHSYSSVKSKADEKKEGFPKQEEKEVSTAHEFGLEGKDDISATATTHNWRTRVVQQICTFLVLCNITLWFIPAFGAHPQLQTGVGKQFFGFYVWFVLVNLGLPLNVFYRMHATGALMELLTIIRKK